MSFMRRGVFTVHVETMQCQQIFFVLVKHAPDCSCCCWQTNSESSQLTEGVKVAAKQMPIAIARLQLAS